MTHYLIEIRYFGKAKHQVKSIIKGVDNKFKLKKCRKVPHITLIQPFKTKKEKWLISDFKKICSKQKTMTFSIEGTGVFPFFVVFAKVKPDEELLAFRKKLLTKLRKYCNIISVNRSFKPHTTIALRMGFFKFFSIWFFMKSKQKTIFTNHVMRATLLKDGKILFEYDFVNRKLLNRKQALSGKELSKTFKRLKNKKKT